ncbi:DegT/DnrJ/EryC1/StrS family aminotransferase [Caldicellulosiruptor morganii]|uniref:DegT/DnrJ/EryC1/StrS family aminotransferase n=1 Tax=Caldicellulosiruptor morganii TaxID=1387555 RepID=A0ABY7BMV1_9FIRM|nr:DegT/DnrJ/EryC1/StrS family aminotransferase [Caldicellulosiruptor morganii]WAM33637.1 DegT/DnrJ/EryC1/StrS family aminotransferase [Caldicellulosiruptor morganii]
MKNENRIYLSPPYLSGIEKGYILDALDSGWIAPLGPHVEAFEKEICEYVGVKYGLATSSGTAAIHLALKYVGVKEGDLVFCSTLTFAGTCFPILYEKAIPVFIDSEPETWNMSPEALEKAFYWAKKEGKLPKAVIVVDLYGQSANYDKLLPICEYYKVPVIEDAAEALGASYKGRKCGSFGYIGIFSFNGNKIITTSGGGMVVSNDEDAIKKMRFWATQAREPVRHYEHKEIGYNYRMSNICATLGRAQLKDIEYRVKRKKEIYYRYKEAFKDLSIQMMPIFEEGEPNYWLSVMTIDENCNVTPDAIINGLEKNNIESRPVWKPMHLQPIFSKFRYFEHDTDVSKTLFEKGICLPSGVNLNEEEQSVIISLIKSIFKGDRYE